MFRIATLLIIVTLMPVFSQVKMLFLGDSLTAGYQLDPSLAYPNQLEKKLGSHMITAINQGISGIPAIPFSIDWISRCNMSHLIWYFYALVPTMVLCGMPIQQTEKNIQTIISKIQTKKIPIIMAGMTLPDNYIAVNISKILKPCTRK